MSFLCLGNHFTGMDCSLLWGVMTVLFFIAATLRKQITETFDMAFTLIGAAIVSEIIFLISVIFFHSIKWGFIFGLVGILIGGFLLAPFLPDSDGGES